MSKKFQFYDIRIMMKEYPEAYYYLAFGERSDGKTFSSLDYCLERWSKTGEQFAYIRRWGEDVRKKNLSELFKNLEEQKRVEFWTAGKWNRIYYGSGKFYLETTDEDGRVIRSEDPIGYAFDLNGMEHYKSISFPRITTIVFDEFISRNGYLPNEWILFTNTLSTIIRLRTNVKILMLGNTVNKYGCPYFPEMGLTHVKDQKSGTIDIYKYGEGNLQVAVEYTGTSKKNGGKPSDVYFAFDNPELKMITTGAWEMAIYPHLEIKYKPKDVVTDFFIMYEDITLHGEVVVFNDGAFVFLHPKTTPIKDEENDIVYTTQPSQKWNFKMCLTKQRDKLSVFILTCLRENRIFYSSNEIGEVFRNYVMWSDSFSIKN